MIQPLSLDVIEGEFTEEYKAWVIQGKNEKFLVIPDSRYPGRKPIRFFMSQMDADRVLNAVLDANPLLAKQGLVSVQVQMLESLRRLALETDPERADSFVVHSPNEVYEFLGQAKPETIH
jgi:hypothetical protein